MTAAHRTDRGSALVVAIVVSAILFSVSALLWAVQRAQLRDDSRGVGRMQARTLALAALHSTTSWFDDGARAPYVPPPPGFDFVARAYVGTQDNPDILLTRESNELFMQAWESALEVSGNVRLESVRMYAPNGDSDPHARATVEVRVKSRAPSSVRSSAVLRADVVYVNWGRIDRPIDSAGDANFVSATSWALGEAHVGGDASFDASSSSLWTGGLPHLSVADVISEDADGDGTPDDVDANGQNDWLEWRDANASIRDPWWRLTVGGVLNTPTETHADMSCVPWRVFASRDAPPRAVGSEPELSAIWSGCVAAASAPVDVEGWVAIARSGARGTWLARESDSRPSWFFLPAAPRIVRPLSAWIPREGEIAVLQLSSSRTTPLELELDGETAGGALLIVGDVRVSATGSREVALGPHLLPADLDGDLRIPNPNDRALSGTVASADCLSWALGRWSDGSAGEAAAGCRVEDVVMNGAIIASGSLELVGPATVHGQVRAETLLLDGTAGEVRIFAAPGIAPPEPSPPRTPRAHLARIRSGW